MRLTGVLLVAAGAVLSGACSEKAEMKAPAETAQAKGSAAAPQTRGGDKDTGMIGGLPTATATAYASSAPQTLPSASDLPGRRRVLQAINSDTGGKIEQADVARTFDDNADKLSQCLTTDATVALKVTILPSGKVGQASVANASPNDPKLRDCVAAIVRTMTFPKLKGTEPASLALDLSLRKT